MFCATFNSTSMMSAESDSVNLYSIVGTISVDIIRFVVHEHCCSKWLKTSLNGYVS